MEAHQVCLIGADEESFVEIIQCVVFCGGNDCMGLSELKSITQSM